MQIDPHIWVFTLPLTIGLIQLYFQPPENALKRLWREALRVDESTWDRLGWLPQVKKQAKAVNRAHVGLYMVIVCMLAVGSLASLGAFMGFLQST